MGRGEVRTACGASTRLALRVQAPRRALPCPDHFSRTPIAPQSNNKRRISAEEWQRKLRDVQVRKEEMNRVVMNFLVTEVRARGCRAAGAVQCDAAAAAAAAWAAR